MFQKFKDAGNCVHSYRWLKLWRGRRLKRQSWDWLAVGKRACCVNQDHWALGRKVGHHKRGPHNKRRDEHRDHRDAALLHATLDLKAQTICQKNLCKSSALTR